MGADTAREGGGISPLLLLGALGERLHVELGQVPSVLVSAQVPLWERWCSGYRRRHDVIHFPASAGFSVGVVT